MHPYRPRRNWPLRMLCSCVCLLIGATDSFADRGKEDVFRHKGRGYLYWGYNRAFYSRSNLHFTGPDYDFTLYRLRAKDRPSAFGMEYINPATFTVPQYVVRAGYFLTDRLHVSIGSDHMKYVITDGQETTISGVIKPEASLEYAGAHLNEPVTLRGDLLRFEHSDGFNLASIDVEYLQPLYAFWKGRAGLSWNFGMGGIWMVTKTDVQVFGDGLDNDFHVAGYALAAKTGPRIDLFRHFFISAECKTGYATLPAVLIKNSSPEIGDHNVLFFEYYVVAGVQVALRRQPAAPAR